MKTRRPFFLQSSSISQIHKKETISLTGLILSFSDFGCFILEFDILKSTVTQKVTGLSSLETKDQSGTTYKTIMFSYVANLVLICSKPCHQGNRKHPAWSSPVVRHGDL